MSNKESQRLKILLVEDDEDDFLLLEDLLSDIEGTQFTLEWVSTYQAALAAVQKNQHDICLFDYWLGEYNGIELLQTVIASGCKTPIIVLTGQGKREQDLEAMQAGAADYLVKGEINASLLERSIRYAINRSQALEALRESEERYALAAQGSHDSLGHLAGDQLLIQVAKRLLECLRPGDVVARLGGDEFAILLERIREVEDTTGIAHRINEELMKPFNLMGHLVYISASIGIALNSQNCQQPEDLLRNADTAMYRAKALGKARYEVFDTTMHAQVQERLQLETALRIAIARGEFYLNYQPIISLAKNQSIGFEALVRWRHPEKGIISPVDFIPVAEETGLIIPLGQWILTEACRQMKAWQEAIPACRSLTISVNLSRKQLSQPDLAEQIAIILQKTGLNAQNLKLEVTETGLINEYEEMAEVVLAQIKDLGVQLSLDDFGTGYSSLSCIHSFPLDTLKLDRAFVNNMSISSKNMDIVRAIITLARGLGIAVTAEGVETAEQLAYLQMLKCDYAQGYFFSKPLASEAATDWIVNTFAESSQKFA
ncbi:MAG: EAL domain-containing protein [Hydrococcus sp. RU_2_2]|nr:EAL domain-containing protein [Hydrococcus sp. RU_2_2]NJP18192.1 EAL domain-containing protein [Hydrococcus sp. CRU_1_1]